MVYGGALEGAFAEHRGRLFGYKIDSGCWAYLAIAIAGTSGTRSGRIGCWIGRRGGRPFRGAARPLVPHVARAAERAERWFERYGDRAASGGGSRRLSVPSSPSRPECPNPARRYTVPTLPGTIPWCFGLARRAMGGRREPGDVPPRVALRGLRGPRRLSRGRRLPRPGGRVPRPHGRASTAR